jgi:hypothetical protein
MSEESMTGVEREPTTPRRRQGAQDPSALETKTTEGAETAKSDAPEPSEEGGQNVQVMFPTDEFIIEGVPVITSGGTALSADQVDTVKEAAKASGVRLMVDGEEVS